MPVKSRSRTKAKANERRTRSPSGAKRKFSPLKADPTRTVTLRRTFMRAMRKRLTRLRIAIRVLVLDDDAFGLKGTTTLIKLNERFNFLSDDQKIPAFQKWFQKQVEDDILQIDPATGEPWTAEYTGSAYKKGAMRAYTDTRRITGERDIITGYSSEQFLKDSFGAPEAVSKIKLIHQRAYSKLKNITGQIESDLSTILADGIAHGQGPKEVARKIDRAITSIERKRALTLARTEIIHAHAEGQLDSFEKLGVEEIGVMAEWSTAGDDRVCERCGSLEGSVLMVKEARGLLPRHPNCRCAWIPANVGEKRKGQVKSKSGLKGQFDNSLRAEAPIYKRVNGRIVKDPNGKRIRLTPDERLKIGRDRSTWPGADAKDFSSKLPGSVEKTVRDQNKPIPAGKKKVVPKPIPKKLKPKPPEPPAPKPKPPTPGDVDIERPFPDSPRLLQADFGRYEKEALQSIELSEGELFQILKKGPSHELWQDALLIEEYRPGAFRYFQGRLRAAEREAKRPKKAIFKPKDDFVGDVRPTQWTDEMVIDSNPARLAMNDGDIEEWTVRVFQPAEVFGDSYVRNPMKSLKMGSDEYQNFETKLGKMYTDVDYLERHRIGAEITIDDIISTSQDMSKNVLSSTIQRPKLVSGDDLLLYRIDGVLYADHTASNHLIVKRALGQKKARVTIVDVDSSLNPPPIPKGESIRKKLEEKGKYFTSEQKACMKFELNPARAFEQEDLAKRMIAADAKLEKKRLGVIKAAEDKTVALEKALERDIAKEMNVLKTRRKALEDKLSTTMTKDEIVQLNSDLEAIEVYMADITEKAQERVARKLQISKAEKELKNYTESVEILKGKLAKTDLTAAQREALTENLEDYEIFKKEATTEVRLKTDIQDLPFQWDMRDAKELTAPMHLPKRSQVKTKTNPVRNKKEMKDGNFSRVYESNKPVRPTMVEEQTLEKALEFLKPLMDRGIVEEDTLLVHLAKVRSTKKQRAWAWDRGVCLTGDNMVTAVHEVGHVIEHYTKEIERMVTAFRSSRVADEIPAILHKKFPDYNFKKYEIGRSDEWGKLYRESSSHYVGKYYDHGSTETLSMGVQLLFENPVKFAKVDPEFFKFVVGILDGSLL